MAELGTRASASTPSCRPPSTTSCAAYNLAHADAPLYVIQGVWIPEERFLARATRTTPSCCASSARDADAVAVVHGDADLPERRGHASGRYRTDIAPWLLAWSLGVEWDPLATAPPIGSTRPSRLPRALHQHARRPTRWSPGSPRHLDYLASLEAQRGWSRPVTFTNWITADPLEHPSEPLAEEDLVPVDAMHMRATGALARRLLRELPRLPVLPRLPAA